MLLRNQWARRKPQGIAAVELALVAPLLMFVTLVTVDFGRFAKTSITVSNAARNGALYGSTWNSQSTDCNAVVDPSGVRQAVLDDILRNLEGVQSSDVTVVVSSTGKDAENYSTVTVTVSLQFKFLFSFNYGGIFSYQGNPTITELCQMRVRVRQ